MPDDNARFPLPEAIAASEEQACTICDIAEGLIADRASSEAVAGAIVRPEVHLFLATDALLLAAQREIRNRYLARIDGKKA